MMEPRTDPFTQERVRWIVALLIAAFYSVVIAFAGNYPIGDDYALLDFTNRFVDAHGIRDSLSLVFAQHNEHRIITTRLAFLACRWILGGVDFRVVIVIGSLSYAGIFILLVRSMPERCMADPRLLVFIACMVFQFGSAESLLCAMAGFSNLMVILCAFAAICCFDEKGTALKFAGAVALSVLAVCTQGNGIIVPVIGVLQLLGKRRVAEAIVVIVVTAALLCGYFAGFEFQGNGLETLRHGLKIAIFALAFLGSAFGVGSTHHPALTLTVLIPTVTVGIGVVGATIAVFRRRGAAGAGPLGWFLVFLGLSASMAAASRYDFDISQAVVSRYHIYSNLAVVCAGLLGWDLITDTRASQWKRGQLMKALPWASLIYVPITFVLILYFHFVQNAPFAIGDVSEADSSEAALILRAAEERGVYHLSRSKDQ